MSHQACLQPVQCPKDERKDGGRMVKTPLEKEGYDMKRRHYRCRSDKIAKCFEYFQQLLRLLGITSSYMRTFRNGNTKKMHNDQTQDQMPHVGKELMKQDGTYLNDSGMTTPIGSIVRIFAFETAPCHMEIPRNFQD